MTTKTFVGPGTWATAGNWSPSGIPAATDDVVFNSSSGACTVGAAALCNSLDLTGGGTSNYTGTFTHSGFTITIGSATAGLGNVALAFPASGWTYTGGSSGAFTFVSTSATQQTVNFGSAIPQGIIFFSQQGSWILGANLTTSGANGGMNCSQGTFNSGNKNITLAASFFQSTGSSTRSLTFGTSTITIGTTWQTATAGLTLSAASSTITFNGTTAASFIPTSGTYGTVNLSPSGSTPIIIGSGFTIGTMTINATAGNCSCQGNFTVTSALAFNGISATSRSLFFATVPGTQITITNTGASVTGQYADFQDIKFSSAVNLSAITGGSGDCGGNTNLTLTTPATQTHTTSAGGNWSDVTKWTSRIPLPQDPVIVDSNTTGTLTMNVPRAGKDMTFTGFVGTLSIGVATIIYGSWLASTGMTLSGTSNILFSGRGTHTITSNGKTFPAQVQFGGFGGTYTLQDALAATNAFTFGSASIGSCTFTANGFDVTVSFVTVNSAGILNMGTGTWHLTLTGTGTIWNAGAGPTINASTATISIDGISAGARTFAGAGKTYGTLNHTVAGSTGALTITGANTFDTINFSDASNTRTLQFTAATITTILSAFNVQGTATKLMVVKSATVATHTLTKTSGTISCDYLDLSNSTTTGGALWYAGANSNNTTSNTGWVFTAPPVKTIMGLAKASAKTIEGLAMANDKSLAGLF